MTEQHPGASSYFDRHGRQRWRYRRRGLSRELPQAPGHPHFEAAYSAAVTGQPQPNATVHALPGAAHPRSLRAAWRVVVKSHKWQELEASSKAQQTGVAERFLATPIEDGSPIRYGDLPIDELKRRHVLAILARWSQTPHAAESILRLLRKLTGAALDQEWIEIDPTFRVSYRPALGGFKAWPETALRAFEARWPLGSTPRTVYALALYQGHRRADVARIRWSDIEADAAEIVQSKTSRQVWIPVLAALEEALAAAPRLGETIIVTAYGQPFSDKSLSMRMRAWCDAAGVPPGFTLHGLRKTLGKMLAEGGATTRQIMAILGHSSIQHAELYTREAEQRILAKGGMDRLKLVKGGNADE